MQNLSPPYLPGGNRRRNQRCAGNLPRRRSRRAGPPGAETDLGDETQGQQGRAKRRGESQEAGTERHEWLPQAAARPPAAGAAARGTDRREQDGADTDHPSSAARQRPRAQDSHHPSSRIGTTGQPAAEGAHRANYHSYDEPSG